MSQSELIAMLKEFDTPQYAEIACRQVFGQMRHFAVPAMLSKAAKDGLVRAVNGETIVGSEKIYPMDLILTDEGRKLCGLPLANPAKQTAKKVEKTLF